MAEIRGAGRNRMKMKLKRFLSLFASAAIIATTVTTVTTGYSFDCGSSRHSTNNAVLR